MKKPLVVLLICPVLSGGEFVNFTFDEPDLTNVRPFKPPWGQFEDQYAPVEEVFQGWAISQVFLNELASSDFQGLANVDGGGSTLSLSPVGGWGTPSYAVKVSNFLSDPWERSAFSLSQIGSVPGDAGTLRWWEGHGPLEVHINGAPLTRQRVDPLLPLWEANVSAYAGQEVELSLEFAQGSGYFFDLLGFMPVPEPSPAALLLVGGALLLTCRRRRKRVIRHHSRSGRHGTPRETT